MPYLERSSYDSAHALAWRVAARTRAETWQRASCHLPFTPLMNRRRSGSGGRGGVRSITKIKESRRENR